MNNKGYKVVFCFIEGTQLERTSAVGELKQLKDEQEMMLGHMERSVAPLSIAEDLDQFKVGRVHTLVDVEKIDVEQCKDEKESTLADTEGSDDKLNAEEGEVESGELFYKNNVSVGNCKEGFASNSFKGLIIQWNW